ncbi:hypothetical protein BD324DRAFT_642905 [Kockovaella imperatae]|uniref:NAD(P)-binding protein n=1 Tax=Kockovaella imperatae TaxID=4999 RepID=A0A1Y1UCI8_9TREE|nr:hypothetical protein BD324DRAFT_642905 [Kockovaella imperatae]ORX35729.1 hypothetical protein BD324DRAFT_642905 [Kockovaella imperatae]
MAWAWSTLLFRIDVIFTSGFPIFFWNRPRWSTNEIPDQTGRVVLVTGGNSGTGYATCKALYEKGATVYLACRSPERAEEAIQDIKRGVTYKLTGKVYPENAERTEEKRKGTGSLVFMELDLADLSSIKRFVEEFKQKEQRLDVLFANAGVMASPEGMRTQQGYTLQFGTNCLGHQYLISLLLPLLQYTSSSNPQALSRVILVSSAGHGMAPRGGFKPESVMPDYPQGGPSWRDSTYGSLDNGSENDGEPRRGKHELQRWLEYGQSKWGGVALARWLHWTYGPVEGREKPEVLMLYQSGMVATNLAQHISLTPYIVRFAPWAVGLITRPPSDGALNQIWAGTCPEQTARNLSGQYLVPFLKVGRARPDLDDLERVKCVWDWCSEQTEGF